MKQNTQSLVQKVNVSHNVIRNRRVTVLRTKCIGGTRKKNLQIIINLARDHHTYSQKIGLKILYAYLALSAVCSSVLLQNLQRNDENVMYVIMDEELPMTIFLVWYGAYNANNATVLLCNNRNNKIATKFSFPEKIELSTCAIECCIANITSLTLYLFSRQLFISVYNMSSDCNHFRHNCHTILLTMQNATQCSDLLAKETLTLLGWDIRNACNFICSMITWHISWIS